MMQSTTRTIRNIGTESTAIPLRFWWLKRIAIGTAALMIALLGLRLWWGHVADRRLQAEIDRILAAGEPLYPADFRSLRLADEHNAAILLEEAYTLFDTINVSPVGAVGPIGDRPADWEPLHEIALENAKVVGLIRQAWRRSGVAWDMQIASPVFMSVIHAQVGGQRNLVYLLCIVALDAHHRGDDAEAVAAVRDTLQMANAIEELPFVIGTSIASTMRRSTVDVIERMAPTLRVVDGSTTESSSGRAASREAVEALIAELLDEQARNERFQRALYGERMMQLDLAQVAANGNLPFRLIGAISRNPSFPWPAWGRDLYWLFRPLFRQDALRMLERSTQEIDAARQPTWPRALEYLPPEAVSRSLAPLPHRPLSSTVVLDQRRTLHRHFRDRAITRMAATGLAVRLYLLDHGRRPESLAALVPDYLPRVPGDPFGPSIGYHLDGQPPYLYSLGFDHAYDTGGMDTFTVGRATTDSTVFPFFLSRRPRVPFAATVPGVSD